MNLSQLLQKLSYGPLSELAIAGQGSGTVPVENIPLLMVPINDALTKLYVRFVLQKRTLVLETVDGIYSYRLAAQFAQLSPSDEPNKYIKDTVTNPFLDDVLLITEVQGNAASLPTDPDYITQPRLDENDYIGLPLNDRNDRLSWFVTGYDTLTMDYPKTGDRYFVHYQAKHLELPLVPADPALVEIRIPTQLEAALLAYVAKAVYGNMSMETALGKSRMHLAIYEEECAALEAKNTFNQFDASSNLKPDLAGWV